MTATGTTTRQLLLPGQTHAAEGPHDQTGMYVMHHAFRRDLARFVRAAAATPLDDAGTWAALLARWDRFASVLHHHHTIEDDSFWPVLTAHAEAAGDRAALGVLADMEAEHAEIDPALADCRDGLARMTQEPTEAHRDDAVARLTRGRDLLCAHMGHEETEALPYLQRVMSQEEYAACEKAAQRGYPLRDIPFLVCWVLDELPEEGRARMIAMAGQVYALVGRLAGGRYGRATRAAFRYA